jgi:hypothetical protein
LSNSINRASKKAVESELNDFYRDSIKGQIYFSNTQKLHCTLFGDIYQNSKQYISIQLCPCNDENFQKFISDADSIIKVSNTYKVTLINNKGELKKLELPFCK